MGKSVHRVPCRLTKSGAVPEGPLLESKMADHP